MPEPARLVPTPRLDDLIGAIKQAHSDDALAQLSNAVLVSDHLGELADSLIGHFVDQARRSGASWTQIGASMGVSKQAAQQRFVPKVPGAAGTATEGANGGGTSPFARFTPRARNALVAAHNDARQTGNVELTPAHLLLGLLSEPEAIAARVLVAGGATMDALSAAARQSLPPQPAAGGTDGEPPELVPYSEASKAVLERTLAEALRLGHNYVGTEHILLALVDIEAEAGGGPLTALGVTPGGVEEAVLAALAR
ncbi:MAG: Clp protease N-terminal domain-containing protein [Acidimicrobiales bacterium]